MSGLVAHGPWGVPNAVLFYGGELSSFAPTPALRLPAGWYGHPAPPSLVEVSTVEHYFHACKACSEADFLWVLAAPTAASAKRRGDRRGEGGRKITLRPDWEAVKTLVMRRACMGKYSMPRYQPVLRQTGTRVLVENSPSDFIWGGRDATGGWGGRNLLGIVLMEVRAALRSAGRL